MCYLRHPARVGGVRIETLSKALADYLKFGHPARVGGVRIETLVGMDP